MERRKSERLDDVLLRFMRMQGLEGPLGEYRLLQSWGTVAGKRASAATTEMFIRNQTLYVRLKVPALRANLMAERSRLVADLNRAAGVDVITSITFL